MAILDSVSNKLDIIAKTKELCERFISSAQYFPESSEPAAHNVFTKPLFDILGYLVVTYTNYADDTQILIPITGDYATDSKTLNEIYSVIQAWMEQHRLCLNDAKTKLLILGSHAMLNKLGLALKSFTVDGNTINVTNNTKTLGIYLDATLSFTRQKKRGGSSISLHLN